MLWGRHTNQMVDTCATYFSKRSLYLGISDVDIVPRPSVHSGCQKVYMDVTESQFTWFIVFLRTFGIVRLIPQIQSSTHHQNDPESNVPHVTLYLPTSSDPWISARWIWLSFGQNSVNWKNQWLALIELLEIVSGTIIIPAIIDFDI